MGFTEVDRADIKQRILFHEKILFVMKQDKFCLLVDQSVGPRIREMKLKLTLAKSRFALQ